MKRKLLTLILGIVLTVTMMPAAAFAGIVMEGTPVPDGLGNTSLKWVYDFQSGTMDFSRAPTVPALIDGAIYVGSGNKVYRFDKENGKILATSPALSGKMGYGTTPMIGDDTGVYVFVTGSKVIKLSADLKKILWTSGTFPGQNITPIKEIDGRIYGGTWGDSKDGGTYFCLDAASGEIIWTQYDTEGFYWAGAVESSDGTVFFASDSSLKDGKTMRSSAHIYAVARNAPKGAAPTLVKDEPNTRIRSTPAVDADGNVYYTSIKPNQEGAITRYSWNGTDLTKDKERKIGTSSNTPVIDGETIFVGDGNYMEGGEGRCIYALDRSTLTIKASVKTPAPVQGELLVARGSDKYRIFATYNNQPGGLYYVEMPLNCSSVLKEGTTFIPIHRQYCISNVVCDETTGTLYYKNDSGAVMAVKAGINTKAPGGVKAAAAGGGKIKVSWNDRENVKSYTLSYSDNGKTYKKAGSTTGTSMTVSNLTPGKTYSFKVSTALIAGQAADSAVVKAVPVPGGTKLSGKNVKKKKVKLSWKKVGGATGVTIYRSTSKNSGYKAIKSFNSMKTLKYTDKKLKKKKTYYYKVRTFVRSGGKTLYGDWSNVLAVKIKK